MRDGSITWVCQSDLSGIGRDGTGLLEVDGKEVARQTMERTLPLMLQWDENFDVGADTGTPVDDKDYQVPFKCTGKLVKLTLSINQPAGTLDGGQEAVIGSPATTR